MKKFTIAIEDEWLEWIRNYQHTALIVTNQSISIKQIIEDALAQYSKGIALPIQERPAYIKLQEQTRSKNIRRGRISGKAKGSSSKK